MTSRLKHLVLVFVGVVLGAFLFRQSGNNSREIAYAQGGANQQTNGQAREETPIGPRWWPIGVFGHRRVVGKRAGTTSDFRAVRVGAL